jgi:hypothetical protein
MDLSLTKTLTAGSAPRERVISAVVTLRTVNETTGNVRVRNGIVGRNDRRNI